MILLSFKSVSKVVFTMLELQGQVIVAIIGHFVNKTLLKVFLFTKNYLKCNLLDNMDPCDISFCIYLKIKFDIYGFEMKKKSLTNFWHL